MKVVEVADHEAVWFRVCETCGGDVNQRGFPLHMDGTPRVDFCSMTCLRSWRIAREED